MCFHHVEGPTSSYNFPKSVRTIPTLAWLNNPLAEYLLKKVIPRKQNGELIIKIFEFKTCELFMHNAKAGKIICSYYVSVKIGQKFGETGTVGHGVTQGLGTQICGDAPADPYFDN